jgi:hypothetical protein
MTELVVPRSMPTARGIARHLLEALGFYDASVFPCLNYPLIAMH